MAKNIVAIDQNGGQKGVGWIGSVLQVVYLHAFRRGTITLYSGLIGGLLAWQYLHINKSPFSFYHLVNPHTRAFIAHGTNNLINGSSDFSRGIDKDNYFRTQYGVHPLAQGFWSKQTHLLWFGVSGFLAALSGILCFVRYEFLSNCNLAACSWRFYFVVLYLPVEVYWHRRIIHFHHLGAIDDWRIFCVDRDLGLGCDPRQPADRFQCGYD